MKDINTIQCAYFAGHFDGEGYIGATITSDSTYRLQFRVSVQGCCIENIFLYQKYFGGGLRKQVKQMPHHKQAWEWYIVSKTDIAKFLMLIEPYAIEKLPQIKLVLDFLTTHIDVKSSKEENYSVYNTLRRLKTINLSGGDSKIG